MKPAASVSRRDSVRLAGAAARRVEQCVLAHASRRAGRHQGQRESRKNAEFSRKIDAARHGELRTTCLKRSREGNASAHWYAKKKD